MLNKHLPLNSGWTGSRSQFNLTPEAAIEYDSGGFGK